MYNKKKRLWFRDNVRIDQESGCWIWVGRRHPKGYGILYAGGDIFMPTDTYMNFATGLFPLA